MIAALGWVGWVAACRGPDGEADRGVRDETSVETGQIPPTETGTPAPKPPNLLVVLLDDVGMDKIEAFGESPTAPPTPTLSALAEEGVRFDNVWATSICAPARAMLLTGRYPRRYGFGSNPLARRDFRIPDRERMLPALLSEAPVPYASAALGKWHLTEPGDDDDYMRDPLDRGFLTHIGTPTNVTNYTTWVSATDGVLGWRSGYLTTATMDDAKAILPTLSEPWFLYLAPNAPHAPPHLPPAALNPGGVTSEDDNVAKYDADLRAVDIELGRILDLMPAEVRQNTVIAVMGDNGTPHFGITPPFDPTHGKVTMYEGGINVPLIVSGPVVGDRGASSGVLASVVDVTATLLEIAGLAPGDPGLPPLDGHSLLPQLLDASAPGERTFVYTERLGSNGPPPWPEIHRAVRDERFKLTDYEHGLVRQLFDLKDRDDDGPDLLLGKLDAVQEEALARLQAEFDRIDAEIPYEAR